MRRAPRPRRPAGVGSGRRAQPCARRAGVISGCGRPQAAPPVGGMGLLPRPMPSWWSAFQQKFTRPDGSYGETTDLSGHRNTKTQTCIHWQEVVQCSTSAAGPEFKCDHRSLCALLCAMSHLNDKAQRRVQRRSSSFSASRCSTTDRGAWGTRQTRLQSSGGVSQVSELSVVTQTTCFGFGRRKPE